MDLANFRNFSHFFAFFRIFSHLTSYTLRVELLIFQTEVESSTNVLCLLQKLLDGSGIWTHHQLVDFDYDQNIPRWPPSKYYPRSTMLNFHLVMTTLLFLNLSPHEIWRKLHRMTIIIVIIISSKHIFLFGVETFFWSFPIEIHYFRAVKTQT